MAKSVEKCLVLIKDVILLNTRHEVARLLSHVCMVVNFVNLLKL